MSTYTLKHLGDVKDTAAEHGLGDGFSARFGREDLACERTGFSLQALAPGQAVPFGHRHDQAEEVYVILEGAGEMLLDGDVVAVQRHDAVRVSPTVVRSFRAGDEGLSLLVFGPHLDGDGETMPVEWPAA